MLSGVIEKQYSLEKDYILTWHILTFKHQAHKMVKHTQIIRRLLPTNYLSVFDHFLGLAFEGSKFESTNSGLQYRICT